MKQFLQKKTTRWLFLVNIIICFYTSNSFAGADIDNSVTIAVANCPLVISNNQNELTRFSVTIPYSFTDLHPALHGVILGCRLNGTHNSVGAVFIPMNNGAISGQKTFHFNIAESSNCPLSPQEIYGEYYGISSAQCAILPAIAADGSFASGENDFYTGNNPGQEDNPNHIITRFMQLIDGNNPWLISPTHNEPVVLRSAPTPKYSDEKNFP